MYLLKNKRDEYRKTRREKNLWRDRDWFRCVQERFKLVEHGIEICPSRRDSLDGQRFLFSTDDIVCDLIFNHYGPGENGIHSNVNGILLSNAYLLGQSVRQGAHAIAAKI